MPQEPSWWAAFLSSPAGAALLGTVLRLVIESASFDLLSCTVTPLRASIVQKQPLLVNDRFDHAARLHTSALFSRLFGLHAKTILASLHQLNAWHTSRHLVCRVQARFLAQQQVWPLTSIPSSAEVQQEQALGAQHCSTLQLPTSCRSSGSCWRAGIICTLYDIHRRSQLAGLALEKLGVR